jgi:hypothetical protein
VEIASAGAAIVRVRLTDFDCAGLAESVTSKVTASPVAAVGVPEITPLERSSDNPPGSDPLATVQLKGGVPPLTASVAL